MGSISILLAIQLSIFVGFCAIFQTSALGLDKNVTAKLFVNASRATARKIPDYLFGIFFEEVNHAATGGLWAELISNRGFEAGGLHSPSSIDPWYVIGDESSIIVSTDSSSCFKRNPIAVRMDVLCDSEGSNNVCPYGGVGIYNPGIFAMNIEPTKTYRLVFYIRSDQPINVTVSLNDIHGLHSFCAANIIDSNVSNWTRKEVLLEPQLKSTNARFQLTTSKKGVIWVDQVSLMPTDTYKGHGFRADIFNMIADLKPGFMRFPGGAVVQGGGLGTAVRWKETVGPWEDRPGQFGDVWLYWTDNGLGHFEFLQLAEDLGAMPLWVFNSGNSLTNQVLNYSSLIPYVQEALDGIEFARGDPNSTWGSVRAAMGHPEPFDLRYVSIGNEDCTHEHYTENYRKFYDAIKRAYPDIKMISNCDGSSGPLNQPADMYDYHIYSSTAATVFSVATHFDNTPRNGPKAFVSEYAVTKPDSGNGSLLGAIAEAGLLIGLEKNSDVVEMASYGTLLVNDKDWRWVPAAIVFDSSRVYGTPSYWMQHFFKNSNGATLLNAMLELDNPIIPVIGSAIIYHNSLDNRQYLRVKVVNFGSNIVKLKIAIDGLEDNVIEKFGAKIITLNSANLMDENSFKTPKMVAPLEEVLDNAGPDMDVTLLQHSLNCFDLLLGSKSPRIPADDAQPYVTDTKKTFHN